MLVPRAPSRSSPSERPPAKAPGARAASAPILPRGRGRRKVRGIRGVALVVALGVAAAPGACTQTHVVLELRSDADAGPQDAAGPLDADTRDAVPVLVTALSISQDHACAIAVGALYCWGANDEGRLGVGDTVPRLSATRVGTEADWKAVAVGDNSSLALKAGGTLYSFGGNELGQLGLGDTSPRTTPNPIGTRSDWTAIALRFSHACALARDGSLWCWGKNSEGDLGQDEPLSVGAPPPRTVPTQVPTDHAFAQVDAGQGHTCAIGTDGTLWCWGRNAFAELGVGSTEPQQIRKPVQVGTAANWQLVQSGQNSTCGLRSGVAYCWGHVLDGGIPGKAVGDVVPDPITISAADPLVGLSFNTFGGCGLDANGGAVCWGRNDEGQLGQGYISDHEGILPLDGSGWTQVSAGRFSSCGIRQGHAVCAGENDKGQLGQSNMERTNRFVEVLLPP